MASRVMNMADAGQVILTQEAYKQVIDMVDDPNLVDRFAEFKGVKIKHGEEITVYQYLGQGEPFISSKPPEDLSLLQRGIEALNRLESVGFPVLGYGLFKEPSQAITLMEAVANLLSPLQAGNSSDNIIEVGEDRDQPYQISCEPSPIAPAESKVIAHSGLYTTGLGHRGSTFNDMEGHRAL